MSDHVQRQIETWWKEFAVQAPRIDALFKGTEEWDLAAWMLEHFQEIHPDLMWEFGPALNGNGHRLVITPESSHSLRPLAREVLRQAPVLDGWEFYEYRVPEDFEQAALTVEGRTSGDIRNVRFQAAVGQFNRINLRFISDHYEAGDVDAFQQAYVATESLLGEEVLNRWIGAIEVSRDISSDDAALNGSEANEAALNDSELYNIRELRAVVENRIEEVRESLPAHRWCQTDAEDEWTAFEMKPAEADDYPDQVDLIVGITLLPQMWTNALQDAPFDSARYSRWGETFCYLKIDGGQGLGDSSFADRSEIEDALNECLRPEGLGCVVGGGTGLQYSYIELALTDVEEAWAAMRDRLQTGGLPERTWLLFHDDDLRATGRGLWDDTPPPPESPE